MKYSNNIISFPKTERQDFSGRITDDEFRENTQDRLVEYKKIYIQQAIETIAPQIFNSLEVIGFVPLEDDEDTAMKDGAIIVEAIRSFMYKIYGIEHPLQPLATAFFSYDADGDIIIADNIKLIISPIEPTPEEEEENKNDSP